MTPIKQQILKLALKTMLKKNHFDICTIDKQLKITGITPNQEDYDLMHSLHCISYSEMNDDIRNWLLNTIEKIFKPYLSSDIKNADTPKDWFINRKN